MKASHSLQLKRQLSVRSGRCFWHSPHIKYSLSPSL